MRFKDVTAYRGKSCVLSEATFQWTRGVKGLVQLVLGTLARDDFYLEDKALYDAMSKQQAWYTSLFGKYRICELVGGITRLRYKISDISLHIENSKDSPLASWLWKELFNEELCLDNYSYDCSHRASFVHSGENLLRSNVYNVRAAQLAVRDLERIRLGAIGNLLDGKALATLSDSVIRMALLRMADYVAPSPHTVSATALIDQVIFAIGNQEYSCRLARDPFHLKTLRLVIKSINYSGHSVKRSFYLQDGDIWFSELKVDVPHELTEIIGKAIVFIISYLKSSLTSVNLWITQTISKLNGQAVEGVYRLLRSYLYSLGVPSNVLENFSLFYHQDGKARYLLDDARLKRVRQTLENSCTMAADESSIVSPAAETLTWYATSYLSSQETMSYSDALVPWRCWDGSPDTWKKPIPGFGASEIGVYGYGVSHAEPVALPSSIESRAMCVVFTESTTPLLREKFLELPELIQNSAMNALDSFAFQPESFGIDEIFN
jgi:hypothetical protein